MFHAKNKYQPCNFPCIARMSGWWACAHLAALTCTHTHALVCYCVWLRLINVLSVLGWRLEYRSNWRLKWWWTDWRIDVFIVFSSLESERVCARCVCVRLFYYNLPIHLADWPLICCQNMKPTDEWIEQLVFFSAYTRSTQCSCLMSVLPRVCVSYFFRIEMYIDRYIFTLGTCQILPAKVIIGNSVVIDYEC